MGIHQAGMHRRAARIDDLLAPIGGEHLGRRADHGDLGARDGDRPVAIDEALGIHGHHEPVADQQVAIRRLR